MRHGLLLTAVATVTVPGLLAVFGVVGHDHLAAEAGGAASMALDGTILSGPFPVAPTTARAGLRDNVAAVQQASGAPVTVLSHVTLSQQAMGMSLLNRAAAAGLATTYQGTEMISQSGVDGSVKVISQVWHQGGGMTLVQTSGSTTSAATSATASDSPEGVFGLTESLVALLGKHYVAVYRGDGTAVDRQASIVELYRFDGSLAARYWLDRQTMVPLRRELFDTSDKVISEDSFVRVQFGSVTGSPVAAGGAAPQSASEPSWVPAGSPARFVATLSAQGWPLPTALPGLPLYTAASAVIASGQVVDLEYTDGLYVISLFVQRGTLAAGMSGWQPVQLAGQQAYVSGHSVTWATSGFVYTMIADAPPQTVTQAVDGLAGDAPPGLLSRLGRGFERLARLLNPFS